MTGTYASSTFVKLVTLAAPVQQEPSDGVTLQLPGEPPRLGWTAVPGAGSYELEFSSAPVMSDPFSGVTRTTSWVLEFLQPGQRLYWRVRAVSRGGTTSGPWSSIRSLAVDFQAIPGGLTPASGSAAPQMVVGWDPLPGAEGYDLAFTPGPALDWSDARTVSVVTAATRYAFDDPTATGPVTWGWRVRARDHHGNVGPWTTPRLITQSLVSGPVLTSPPNGTHIEEVAVLRWNPVHGASHYRVDVSPDPSFATKLDTHVTTETIFDLTTREEIDPFVLVKGTTYYWRVRGLDRGPSLSADARPASDWSSSGSFVYDPPVATLLSPADGSTITVPTLSWTAPGATFVKVTIRDRHGTFVDRALTYADSYTPPDRLDAKNGPFTWYVQRVALSADPDPTVAWTSAMWTFDLDPISATVSDPTPNVVPPSVVTPSISWTPVVGADHYDVFPGTVPPPPDAAYALNPRVLHYPAFTYAIGDLDVGAHDFHVRAYDAA
ncbi:MAG TPA: hypothetical protein VK194_04035, partial [Candidatus Deferrimicrobium sp.]|nr:hypothetical protein [Candidatus Deferrimicrobium sp.]